MMTTPPQKPHLPISGGIDDRSFNSSRSTAVLHPSVALVLIAAMTLYRVVMLAFDRTDLFVDEAQYWLWSQHLAFGYYSKPPMIAWVISATTALGGSDTTFWVRLASPLFHIATALVLSAAALRLTENRQIAAWTGITFMTLPGVALSSVFISTDTFQLFFYALALLAYAKLIRTSSAVDALLLGAAIGLGFLSKYPMLFFVATAAVAAVIPPKARIGLRDFGIAAVVAAVLIAPNILWNAANGNATFRHTSDNANWNGINFHIDKAAEFLGGQFGVVGPVLFATLLVAAYRALRRRSEPLEWHLVLLTWPVILAIVCQALMSRAYANWAAPAYIAGTILAVLLLFKHNPRALKTSLVINGAIALLFPIATVFAPNLVLPNGEPLLKRYLGRSELSRDIASIAEQQGLKTIVAENRDVLADLFYTLRDRDFVIRARPTGKFPDNYYRQEFTFDITASQSPVLLVTSRPVACAKGEPELLTHIAPGTGYMAGTTFNLYRILPECLAPATE